MKHQTVRSCQNLSPSENSYLQFYSCSVARKWVKIRFRTFWSDILCLEIGDICQKYVFVLKYAELCIYDSICGSQIWLWPHLFLCRVLSWAPLVTGCTGLHDNVASADACRWSIVTNAIRIHVKWTHLWKIVKKSGIGLSVWNVFLLKVRIVYYKWKKLQLSQLFHFSSTD